MITETIVVGRPGTYSKSTRPPATERRARRAASRAHRIQLVDELLADLARLAPASTDPEAGTIALAFRPSDPQARHLDPVCHLGGLRMACLRHRRSGGRTSLPLTLHRFELDPPSAEVRCHCVAAYDLAANPGGPGYGEDQQGRHLTAAAKPTLATLAITMHHHVAEYGRGDLPDRPRFLPEFLVGFQELPEPAPLVFEENPTVLDLAAGAGCDTDEIWRLLQEHVLLDRAGRVTALPRGTRRPEADELPSGVRLYSIWPSYLFTRDGGTYYEAHPVDGSPRPADSTPPEETKRRRLGGFKPMGGSCRGRNVPTWFWRGSRCPDRDSSSATRPGGSCGDMA